MPEREGFPAGVPSWIDTEQADVDAAATFYAGVLGWQFDAWILPLQPGASPHWSVSFAVADADAVAAAARDLGGSVVVEPFDIPPVRSTVIDDPAGARFTAIVFKPG